MEESPYTAVMLDLETMSTQNNASIVAIGAVKFWLNVSQDTFTPDQLFHVVVDLTSCQQSGLHVDAETVKWWLKQDKEAQDVLVRGITLAQALNAFLRWFPKDALIFGNGSTFDNVILRNAFKTINVKYPVSYKNDVCYRTLSKMSNVEPPKFEGIKHNALHDAMAQTKHLMAILARTPWNGK